MLCRTQFRGVLGFVTYPTPGTIVAAPVLFLEAP